MNPDFRKSNHNLKIIFQGAWACLHCAIFPQWSRWNKTKLRSGGCVVGLEERNTPLVFVFPISSNIEIAVFKVLSFAYVTLALVGIRSKGADGPKKLTSFAIPVKSKSLRNLDSTKVP